MDLLDECWFFHNVLIPSGRRPATDNACYGESSEESNVGCRVQTGFEPPALHRMPTLPPRFARTNTMREEAIRPLQSCNPKLRYSLSSLDHYQSKNSLSSPNAAKDRPPGYVKLERTERYLAIQHYIAKEAYYRKVFKEKKWRSHNDLECIEVQGFKDLGFVFDKDELKARLVKVLPGLREKASYDEKITAGPVRSTEDMKEQLKFWARAVATNARKES